MKTIEERVEKILELASSTSTVSELRAKLYEELEELASESFQSGMHAVEESQT